MSKRRCLVVVVFFTLVVGYGLTQGVVAGEGSRSVGWPEGPRSKPGAREQPGSQSDGSPLGSGESPRQEKVEALRSGDRDINAPVAVGGPDTYGYTWNNGVSYSWETTSTNSGITGDDNSVEVSIGFPFKFYEQVWNNVYITTNGILVFGDSDNGCCGGFVFPSPETPNNVIAPFSEDLAVGGSYNSGGIYLKNGGTTPNRFFVVEWRDVTVWWDDFGDPYTFQVILHENGDIVYQYQTISDTWWDYSIGIEDSYGLDGLQYPYPVPNGDAIRFYRPAPAARVRVYKDQQGNFIIPGDRSDYRLEVANHGELGNDTFDVSYASSFPLSLYASDGTTPLIDTDGDTVKDTGLLPQGSSTEIVVKVDSPYTATLGVHNTAFITLTSSINVAKTDSATLQQAVPTRFAQSYLDEADFQNSLYLALPEGDGLIQEGSYGNGLAIAEGPTNFAYVWNEYSYLSTPSVFVSELHYAVIDASSVYTQQLTNLSVATVDSYDYDPAVAVAPNGSIGIVWDRSLDDWQGSTFNENIYFAILDSGGSVTHGPVNVTGISGWGTYRITDPRITATGDNRFVLAWQRSYSSSGDSYNDVYYAIYGTDGSVHKAQTKHTNDTGADVANYNPSLASLANNRVLLVHQNYTYADGSNLYYTVLDSLGNTIQVTTNLTSDSWGIWDWISDAVELSDGNIFITWMDDDNLRIRYAILNASYNIIHGPTDISNPLTSADGWMSVTADANGNAVITWQDLFSGTHNHLYYTLIDSSGIVVTPPMIFRSSNADVPYIYTHDEGYGNTTYLNDHDFPWEFYNHVYLPLVIR